MQEAYQNRSMLLCSSIPNYLQILNDMVSRYLQRLKGTSSDFGVIENFAYQLIYCRR
jgi:hypothetical protein